MKLLPLLVGLVALTGCSSPPESNEQVTPKQPIASEPAIPMEELQASYQETATKYEATKDDASKAAYVDATVAYATAVMSGDGKPNEKYPKSLKLFDEALRLDPDNEEAKTNRQLILDIYKSMGKEPPK